MNAFSNTKLVVVAMLGLVFSAPTTQASVIINLFENNSGVVGQAFGSLDLAGLGQPTLDSSGAFLANINNVESFAILVGPLTSQPFSSVFDLADGPDIPGGGGGVAFASSGSGFKVGIFKEFQGGTRLFIDQTYASGSTLRSRAFWENETLSPRFDEGRYIYELPSSDTVTINIGAPFVQPIPTPAGMSLLGTALLALSFARLKRTREKGSKTVCTERG